MLDLTQLSALLPEPPLSKVRPFSVGGQRLDFERERYLVGVVNLSPDSWYKESVCTSAEAAIARGERLAAAGAKIIDIGAESSLPEAARVGVSGQLDRLLPVVRALAAAGILVSVESYHPEVLEACAEAGARIFNLTGPAEADAVFSLAARYEAAVVLCYVAGDNVRAANEGSASELAAAGQLAAPSVPALSAYFERLTARARALGLERCFLDPGLGFYYRALPDGPERVRYQLKSLLSAGQLWSLGYPIFNILPHAPGLFGEAERRGAEPFFGVIAALFGSHLLRTHEVEKLAPILKALELYE